MIKIQVACNGTTKNNTLPIIFRNFSKYPTKNYALYIDTENNSEQLFWHC
jgi:hypothetical protein